MGARAADLIGILTMLAAAVTAFGPPRGTVAADRKSDAEEVFALRVLPALKTKCYACHGADTAKIKGGLELTARAALLKGGDSGKPGIVVGKSADSPLVKAIIWTDADFSAMPPKENDKLTDAEVTAFKDWIDGGAPWPSEQRIAEIVKAAKPAGVTVKTSGGLSADWTDRTYKPEVGDFHFVAIFKNECFCLDNSPFSTCPRTSTRVVISNNFSRFQSFYNQFRDRLGTRLVRRGVP